MRLSKFKWVALIASALLFAAACGGGDDDGDGGTSPKPELGVEIDADKVGGNAPLEVSFQSSVTVQGQEFDGELDYSWDFGDGNSASEANPTHTFEDAGDYRVELEVTEAGDVDNPRTANAEINVNVKPPTFSVEVSASTTEAQVGEAITFTCSQDPSLEGSSFEWTDDTSSGTASGEEYTKTFQETGVYNVTCTVTGPEGEQEEKATTQVTISKNPKPEIIALNANPRTGIVPVEVSFSANVSYSGDDELAYSWNFGDSAGSTSTEKAPSFTYQNAGTYTASLTVTDEDGDEASKSVEIDLIEDGPVAIEIANPSNDTVSGVEPLDIDFEASVSGTNEPIDVEWDFGDGTTSKLTNPSHTFNFSQDAPYTVTVTAEDKDGDTAEDSITVDVKEDTAVSAVASVDSANTDSGKLEPRNVAFKCSASEGNEPFEYSWDFGDGSTKDLGEAKNGNTSHTYDDASGSPFTATCTVTDSNGDTATANTGQVEVIADTEPSIDAINVTSPDSFKLSDGTATVDFSATVTSGNSPLSWEWTFGDGSDASTKESPSHDYTSPGNFTVTLKVTDNDGDTVTSSKDLPEISDINKAPSASLTTVNDIDCHVPRYSNGSDTFGGDSITFDATGSTDPEGETLDFDWSFVTTASDGPRDSNGDLTNPYWGIEDYTGESFAFTPNASGDYAVKVCVTDPEGAKDCATHTVSSNFTHNIVCESGCEQSGKSGDQVDPIEFKVQNNCGKGLEGIGIKYKQVNFDATTGPDTDINGDVDVRTDSKGMFTNDGTLGQISKNNGKAELTVETAKETSYWNNDPFDGELDSLTTTHTIEAGDPANVIVDIPNVIDASNHNGSGGDVVFKVADKNWVELSNNPVDIEFTAKLTNNSNGCVDDDADADLDAGFINEQGDGLTCSKTFTIPAGQTEITKKIYSERASLKPKDTSNRRYVQITGTVTQPDGSDLPGVDNSSDPDQATGASKVKLIDEGFEDLDFEESSIWTRTKQGNNNPVKPKNFWQLGEPSSGPGSADGGSSVLGTVLNDHYNADFAGDNNAMDNYGHSFYARVNLASAYPNSQFGIKSLSTSFRGWVDTPLNNNEANTAWALGYLMHDGAKYKEDDEDVDVALDGNKLCAKADCSGGADPTAPNGFSGSSSSWMDISTKEFVQGVGDGNDNVDDSGFATGELGQFKFGFRAEHNENFSDANQPTGAGWFVDNLKVTALAKAAQADFVSAGDIQTIEQPSADDDIGSAPNSPTGYDSKRSTSTNTTVDDSFEGIAANADAAQGWVEFRFKDEFGNNVPAGSGPVKFNITEERGSMNGSAEIVSAAKGQNFSVNMNNAGDATDPHATAHTNENGAIRLKIQDDEVEGLTVQACPDTDEDNNCDASKRIRLEFIPCDRSIKKCKFDYQLDTRDDSLTDNEKFTYLKDATPGAIDQDDDYNWKQAGDETTSPVTSPNSHKYLSGVPFEPNVRRTYDGMGYTDLIRNNYTTDPDGDGGSDAVADDGPCQSLNGIDLVGADQVFAVQTASHYESISFEVWADGSANELDDGDLAVYLVEDPTDIAGTCMKGALDDTNNDELKNGDESETASGPDAVKLKWKNPTTSTNYLIIDSAESSLPNSKFSLILEINNDTP